jgi:hypothetical protein
MLGVHPASLREDYWMQWEPDGICRYIGSPVKCGYKFSYQQIMILFQPYGIKVVAGRGFSRDYGLDTSAFSLSMKQLQNFSALKILKML